jgi:hypothetical protein
MRRVLSKTRDSADVGILLGPGRLDRFGVSRTALQFPVDHTIIMPLYCSQLQTVSTAAIISSDKVYVKEPYI